MILSDREIEKLAGKGMISPFVTTQIRQVGRENRKVISWGLSSYGYDIRISDEFRVFDQISVSKVDPKDFDSGSFRVIKGDCTIPPNSFCLGKSVELFDIPRDILAICLGKSTYARCGIIVNVTPLEPEWRGVLTIEISNTSPLPCLIHAHEGIAQLIFMRASKTCRTSYKDRGGKYQDQKGIETAKV